MPDLLLHFLFLIVKYLFCFRSFPVRRESFLPQEFLDFYDDLFILFQSSVLFFIYGGHKVFG